MTLLTQSTAQEVSSGAGFQTDERFLEFSCVGQQLLLRELLPHQHLARCSECQKVKGRLAQVNADGMNLHSDDPPETCCSQSSAKAEEASRGPSH